MKQGSESNSRATNWVLGVFAAILMVVFASTVTIDQPKHMSTHAEQVLEIRN